jgi:hypothetical protein
MQTGRAVHWFQVHQSWIGVLLVAVFWPLNWMLPGTPTAYLFFPLWLGYILLVDGLVLTRTGTSRLERSPRRFASLFFISAPAWWVFEWINQRTHNWEYPGSEKFSGMEYFLLCTVSFSTVMPAVFESAELMRSFGWVEKFSKLGCVRNAKRTRISFLVAGLAMLGLMLAWPQYCYPFVWISLALILEAINAMFGRSTLLQYLDRGDWRPMVCLGAGALLCGFFWELWNYYSYPKWIYHTPGVQFLHIFEMPLLGYLGYIPFAWELYGLHNLFCRPEPDFLSKG